MTTAEADEQATRLKGLLPKMTQEQVYECAKEFERHDRDVVAAAVTRYHREHEEFFFTRLLAAIRQELRTRAEASGSRYTDNNGRVVGAQFIDVLRRQPGAAGKSDRELLIEDIGNGWRHLQGRAMDDEARASVRAQIFRIGRDRLIRAGVPADGADAEARIACGYGPDELVPEHNLVDGIFRSAKESFQKAELEEAVTESRRQKQLAGLMAAELREKQKGPRGRRGRGRGRKAS